MPNFVELYSKLEGAQAKIKEAQEKLPAVKQKIGNLRATRETGGGLVKATVDGHRKLLKIEISPTIINPSDQETLQDLILAASNLATEDIEEEASKIIIQSAASTLGPIKREWII
ncbi:MAG: YbaB/EbfC family nucleoid-associated protein [Bacteroidota bacterium]